MVAVAQYYQRAKNGVHALQALLIFIGAAITIAVFTKGGQGDGRVTYYFILCWLCIPALIYQAAFPTFERTKRFANPYAHALIDIIYTILWFAAFIALFVWAKQGSHAAKGWDSKKDKTCDKFAWGPTSKCKLGHATGSLAILICLLFVLTTAISIYGILQYRAHGSLPARTKKAPEAIPTEDQEEDYTFSSNPHDRLDQEQEMLPTHYGNDDVSSLHPTEIEAAHQNVDRMSWHRTPSPDLPFDWDRRSTPDVAMGEGWINRRKTPDLPVGENYYQVDTSYHGGRESSYDPPQQQHRASSSLGGRTPSPYDPPQRHRASSSLGGRAPSPYGIHERNESDDEGILRPGLAPPAQLGVRNPFGDELGLRNDSSSRLEFPDADYARLGH